MDLKTALGLKDGTEGFEVVASIKGVYDPKVFPSKYGEFKVQNISIRDISDEAVSCLMGIIKENFFTKDQEGSIITFMGCKKTSYEDKKKPGTMVSKLECRGTWIKVEGSTATPPIPGVAAGVSKPLPPAPIKKEVDWDKKELIIARESALKSASGIIAAQLAAGCIPDPITNSLEAISEYATRMADFFVNFTYEGLKEEGPKGSLDERIKIINTIKTAQARYSMNDIQLLDMATEVANEAVEDLTTLGVDVLSTLLTKMINMGVNNPSIINANIKAKDDKKEPVKVEIVDEEQSEIPF